MLLSHGELFTPLDLKRRLFRKVGSTGLRDRAAAEIYGRRPSGAPATPPSTLAQLVHESLYTGPFAQVIVDAESRLSFANARAQSMFTIGPRDVGRPFQDLELSYRPVELRGLIDRVSDERRPIELKDVEWVRGVGDTVVLDVAAVPLIGPQGTVIGASVTLMDVTRYRRLQEEHELATRQLEMAYEELQSTNEELETTNEELQSTVEELETTNEELQSTNEELETMNEELHSTNDELQVINDELRERSRELAELGDFMDAVMAGLQVGLIVVDVDMRVIVWNEQSYDLWGLRSDEAVGAHLLNLDIGLPTDKLRPAVRRIIAGDVEISTEELPARNRRGRELTVQVTSTPLAGPQGISGCILAMSAVDGSPREEGT
jgi:two-component system CheB/CheR fusion protein